MLFNAETWHDWLLIGLIFMHGFWVFVWLGGRNARRESRAAHSGINGVMTDLQNNVKQLSELSTHIISNLDRLEKMGPERVRELLEEILRNQKMS